ncbi:MAG: phytoene desaturase family protein, partial [Bacilli bacterium]
SWRDYTSPSLAAGMLSVHPLTNMNAFWRKYIKDERLIQALNRYATYIGSSPYQTPATFALIASLEFNDGVYWVEGGNARIADTFYTVGKELGVQYHFNTKVTQLTTQNGSCTSLVINENEGVHFDDFILNGDLLHCLPELIPNDQRTYMSNKWIDKQTPTSSAFVILASTNKIFPSLLHHNVFFPPSSKEEFTSLFDTHSYIQRPTVYIANSSYTDPSVSPDGSNLFILVNAPSLGNTTHTETIEKYTDVIYDTLLTYDIDVRSHLVAQKIITPEQIQRNYSSWRGALYGLASHTLQNSFRRPSNVSKDFDNLYFVGGTTHPGGGSPMVTISGQNVANYIMNRYHV